MTNITPERTSRQMATVIKPNRLRLGLLMGVWFGGLVMGADHGRGAFYRAAGQRGGGEGNAAALHGGTHLQCFWGQTSHNLRIARGVHAARSASEWKTSNLKSFFVRFPEEFARSIERVARGVHAPRNATE